MYLFRVSCNHAPDEHTMEGAKNTGGTTVHRTLCSIVAVRPSVGMPAKPGGQQRFLLASTNYVAMSRPIHLQIV